MKYIVAIALFILVGLFIDFRKKSKNIGSSSIDPVEPVNPGKPLDSIPKATALGQYALPSNGSSTTMIGYKATQVNNGSTATGYKATAIGYKATVKR